MRRLLLRAVERAHPSTPSDRIPRQLERNLSGSAEFRVSAASGLPPARQAARDVWFRVVARDASVRTTVPLMPPIGARRTTCSARTIASDAILRTSGEDLMAFTDVFSRYRPAFPSRSP